MQDSNYCVNPIISFRASFLFTVQEDSEWYHNKENHTRVDRSNYCKGYITSIGWLDIWPDSRLKTKESKVNYLNNA